MLRPIAKVCFKEWEAVWLDPSDKLRPRFCILRDYDVAVTVNCLIAIATAAFAMFLVMTLLVVMLAVVDP